MKKKTANLGLLDEADDLQETYPPREQKKKREMWGGGEDKT